MNAGNRGEQLGFRADNMLQLRLVFQGLGQAEPRRGESYCALEHQSSVYRLPLTPFGDNHRDSSSFTRSRRLACARRDHRIRGSILGYRPTVQERGLERRILQSRLCLCRIPTIGEGGFIVGGAHGTGRVYVGGTYVGDSSVTQLSVGFQAGGKAYSEIVFFEDKRALDEFESGSFEFDAGASAIAVTAGANASAGTTGAESGASGGKKDATTDAAGYFKGMAVFTIAKGGLMYAVTVAGQKFDFTPRAKP